MDEEALLRRLWDFVDAQGLQEEVQFHRRDEWMQLVPLAPEDSPLVGWTGQGFLRSTHWRALEELVEQAGWRVEPRPVLTGRELLLVFRPLAPPSPVAGRGNRRRTH